MKLSYKFSSAIALSSLVLAGCTGWFVFDRVYSELRAQIVEQQQRVTQQMLDDVDRFLSERLRDALHIAESAVIENPGLQSQAEIVHQLKQWSTTSGPWDELLSVDRQGLVIAAASDEYIGYSILQYAPAAEVFQRALLGEPVYSDAVPSHADPRPTIIFGAPVRSEGAGRPVIGVLIGEVAWPSVEEILASAPIDQAHLYTRDGGLIAAIDHVSSAADAALFSKPGDLVAQGMIVVDAPENGFAEYYGNGWLLQTAIMKSKVNGPAIRTAIVLTFVVILLQLSLLAFLFAFIGRQVIQPILRLRQGVDAFASGDLGRRIDVRSRDEFGALAAAFNVMAGRLADQNARKEERLRVVIDDMSDGFQIIDSEYRYVYVNDSVVVQGKTSRERLLGRTMTECYPGIDRTPFWLRLQECMEKRVRITMENEFRFPDGSVGWFLLNMQPVEEGVLIISTDVTDRTQSEKRAVELAFLKNKFITVVSHQLRTPLAAVRWNIETILAGDLGKLRKEQSEFLRMTYEANGEVIRRINDFLLALDIDEGRTTATKEQISIESLWQSVMGGTATRCELKGLACRYEAPKRDLPVVAADAEKIRTAMVKISENALQYTPKGLVTFRLFQVDGRVRFEVEDTGIGIPKDEQAQLFHRFFRATNALLIKTDASGLGLYIAKHYIESHGGKIGFESVEGKGSTFWFEIPVK